MTYKLPKKIDLTPEETSLYKVVRDSSPSGSDRKQIANSQQRLFESLKKRGAIPEIRLRVFSDPDCAETLSRSPKEVFEANGTKGVEILRHGNFQKYLLYFVEGPELPHSVMEGFCKILNEDRGTSGMVLDQVRKYVRKCVRDFQLERHSAATAFFRLALEVQGGIDPRTVREAALSTK